MSISGDSASKGTFGIAQHRLLERGALRPASCSPRAAFDPLPAVPQRPSAGDITVDMDFQRIMVDRTVSPESLDSWGFPSLLCDFLRESFPEAFRLVTPNGNLPRMVRRECLVSLVP